MKRVAILFSLAFGWASSGLAADAVPTGNADAGKGGRGRPMLLRRMLCQNYSRGRGRENWELYRVKPCFKWVNDSLFSHQDSGWMNEKNNQCFTSFWLTIFQFRNSGQNQPSWIPWQQFSLGLFPWMATTHLFPTECWSSVPTEWNHHIATKPSSEMSCRG